MPLVKSSEAGKNEKQNKSYSPYNNVAHFINLIHTNSLKLQLSKYGKT